MKSSTTVYTIACRCVNHSFVTWPKPGYCIALCEHSRSQTLWQQDAKNWRLLEVMPFIAALAHGYGNPNAGADSVMHVSDIQCVMRRLLSVLN